MKPFSFKVIKNHGASNARVTRLTTPHGSVLTPVFMPVGTRAGVNNMTPQELLHAGSQLILGGNTYHMLCAPGLEVIERAGGMHPFMGWHGPMLTDSGGFQVYSLARNKKLCTIDETGAHFKLPGADRIIHMTPETSLHTQKIIGADIIMAFDQCASDDFSYIEAQKSMERTHRWLKQSMAYHARFPLSHYGAPQALFAIIQGGIYQDLRAESAAFIADVNPDGIAIGGESIGFNMEMTVELIRCVKPYLPANKPRYTMGVGMSPQDLLDVVAEGIDMFDCVAPTRNARHGALYSGQLVRQGNWFKFESPYPNERLQIKKIAFAKDMTPVMPGCDCYTCKHYSRAYLHHLFKEKAEVFSVLASIHNVHVMHNVCRQMREHIL